MRWLMSVLLSGLTLGLLIFVGNVWGFSLPQLPTPPTPPSVPTPPRPPQLLVKFAKDANKSAILGQVGASVVAEIPQLNVSVVSVKDQTAALGKLRIQKIDYAEIDAVATKTLSDPLYASQWGLPKISWNKLDASSSAYQQATSSAFPKIAVIDTGVDYNHPDLTGKVDTLNDWDFVNNDNDAMDDESHGTHVAGIAAASTLNDQGISAVSINSSTILPMKVLDQYGSGYYSWIAQGIIRAADQGARVINLSLGGRYNSTTLLNAVNYAFNKGSVVVAAAGNNDSTRAFYPAYYSNSIAVWASTRSDTRASFSNYGSWVDVGAPGVAILGPVPGGNYESWNGTSMATPHVSGLAGLLLSQHPGWSASQVRGKIESTADPVPDRNYSRGRLGKGRINVYRALTQ